jgi:hypothetical protein
METLKKMKYGSEIFLYSKNYLEIEAFIKSSCQKQENMTNPIFRSNMMRNAAEFNSLAFDSGKENFWKLIKERNIMEDGLTAAMKEAITYKQNFKLPDLDKKDSDFETVDGLVGNEIYLLILRLPPIFII